MSLAQIIEFTEKTLDLKLEPWQIRWLERQQAVNHIAEISLIRAGKTRRELTARPSDPVGKPEACRCRYDVHPHAGLGQMIKDGILGIYCIQDIWHGDELVGYGVYSFRIHSRCPHHGDAAYSCTCVGAVAMRGLPCPTHHIGAR